MLFSKAGSPTTACLSSALTMGLTLSGIPAFYIADFCIQDYGVDVIGKASGSSWIQIGIARELSVTCRFLKMLFYQRQACVSSFHVPILSVASLSLYYMRPEAYDAIFVIDMYISVVYKPIRQAVITRVTFRSTM